VEENGEVCEEAPLPPHPCEDTWAAGDETASQIADSACDILDSAPFAECHALVSPDTAKYNCKYDVCSCYDSDCGCSAIKQYAQACMDAGVTSVQKWREVATFCPLTCNSPYAYFICGSNCPATCADPNPDCGRGGTKCNEGCFCPVGTFEQNGTCVSTEECVCLYNGETKEVGDQWYNEGTCKDCECKAAGDVQCITHKCTKCTKQELPFRPDPDDCCNTCYPDWLNATNPVMADLVVGTEATISCDSILVPNSVVWEYSGDEGATWTKIEAFKKAVKIVIDSVAVSDAGLYRCTAKKNYRTASAITTVTVKAPIAVCTAVAPENGAVTPQGQVPVGDSVTYSCSDKLDQGFYIQGDSVAVCQGDGSLALPVCVEKDKVTITTSYKWKGTDLGLNCKSADKTFNKGKIVFWYQDDGVWVQLPASGVKYNAKSGNHNLTLKNIKSAGLYRCTGTKGVKYVYEVIYTEKKLKKKKG